MSPQVKRARGTPCSYCAVPVLHPNQQCCLNCKNHPFDILETDEAPTPPRSPTTSNGRAVSAAGNPLAFEIRNIRDGSFVQVSADDLRQEALWRHYDAGLVFEIEQFQGDQNASKSELGSDEVVTNIIANHAVGIKINGNAYGKTCLHAGDQYVVSRDDENMAGSVIIHEEPSFSFGNRIEYSISEDSLDYTRVKIKADSKAWYDSSDGHPSAWLFHERTLYKINAHDNDTPEPDFDHANSDLHGVVFDAETEGQYVGPDNLYDDRLLIECEGTEFSIKRENLVVEVELNENAYAQKLRESYSDQEQFWFQFGDKVVFVEEEEVDAGRVVVRYEDENFSIAREDIDL